MKLTEHVNIYVVEHENVSYSRVNEVWCVNTGGPPQKWTPLSTFRGKLEISTEELEDMFWKIIREN